VEGTRERFETDDGHGMYAPDIEVVAIGRIELTRRVIAWRELARCGNASAGGVGGIYAIREVCASRADDDVESSMEESGRLLGQCVAACHQ
jgi:hypothetical protein